MNKFIHFYILDKKENQQHKKWQCDRGKRSDNDKRIQKDAKRIAIWMMLIEKWPHWWLCMSLSIHVYIYMYIYIHLHTIYNLYMHQYVILYTWQRFLVKYAHQIYTNQLQKCGSRLHYDQWGCFQTSITRTTCIAQTQKNIQQKTGRVPGVDAKIAGKVHKLPHPLQTST